MATTTKKRAGIELAAADLKAALAAVSPAVPTRGPKPIMQNVRLGDGLLTGSDGEVRIDVAIDYHGDSILLPHGRLSQIIGAANGDTVTLQPGETSCVVKAGSGTWTLPTESPAEYPMWEPADAKPVTRLPADQFCRAVRGVVFAVDDESSRYALGAVLVEVKGETVSFVATDGRRLSLVECEHDLAVDDSQTLVPSRAMAIVSRLALADSDGSVQLEATGKELVATVGSATVTARLIEGRFPRWRDVVPEMDVEPTTVLAEQLLAAVKAAAIVTTEQSRGIDFVFSDKGLWLHGQSAEAGESSVTCELVEAGAACSVKLDPRYVRQWLEGLPADGEPTVSVQAKDGQSAVILRTDCHTGVVMPMAKD
ncbi:MAG: DNA polymerase III subunit beta [Betaproteobacteria bacterium]|nr:DNA polymerase III subunit beta [Betaproteobacteria bacterium]